MNLYVHKESSAGAPDRIAISDENELATQNHFQQLFPLDNDRQGVTVPMYLFKAVQAGHARVCRAVSGIWGVLDKTYQKLATFRSETNNKFDETNKLLKRLLNVVEGGETPPTLEKVPLVLSAPGKSNQDHFDADMEEKSKEAKLLSRPPPHLVSKLEFLQGMKM